MVLPIYAVHGLRPPSTSWSQTTPASTSTSGTASGVTSGIFGSRGFGVSFSYFHQDFAAVIWRVIYGGRHYCRLFLLDLNQDCPQRVQFWIRGVVDNKVITRIAEIMYTSCFLLKSMFRNRYIACEMQQKSVSIKVYFTLWVVSGINISIRNKSKLKILTRKRKVRGSPCTQNGLTLPHFHNGQGRGLWHNGHNLTYHTLHKSRSTLWHHNLNTK